MRDLLRHMGDVHRWAAAHVAEARQEPIRSAEEVAGPIPEDADLLAWFREGHRRLCRTLTTAPADLRCWTFLPAPSSVAFWARRQAHETGMHRADAESAGGRIEPFDAGFAEDGIDELLFGFFGRRSDERREVAPWTLQLSATDRGGEWFLRPEPAGLATTREHGDADCSVRARASDLYLLLWNRRSPDGLDVDGDVSVLGRWRDTMQIHWSRSR
jgi:uncharacterized protein (TIGR03083 family)